MKGREITTLEELRELAGKKITCTIVGNKIEDCLVHVGKGERGKGIYLLQNVCEGAKADCLEKEPYTYSFWIECTQFNECLEEVYTVEEDNYIYGEVINTKTAPDWFNVAKPIFVYYSDQSEEKAVEAGDIRLCVGFDGTGREPFILSDTCHFEDYHDLCTEDSVPHDGAEDRTTTYTFAVPVTREPTVEPTNTLKGTVSITKENGETVEIKLTPEQLAKLV